MIETIDGQTFLRVPITLSKTPVDINRPPAEIGDHSQEVLKEVGFSEKEIQGFMDKKIIRG